MYLLLALHGAVISALRPMPYRDALQKVLGSFDEGSLVGAIGAAVKLRVSTQNIHIVDVSLSSAAAD